MAEHIGFPSINQYRNAIKLVSERAAHDGVALPKLWFVGTVKLHGTNAAIQYATDGMHCQSRTAIITPQSDNAGFAAYVEANRDAFERIGKVGQTIYGEWCGGNIQKGVAINGLPKMFVVFAIREGNGWLSRGEMRGLDVSPAKMIYDFPHWIREIDFSRPQESQNELIALTEAVETECPVGATMGQSGVGEGIVWWPVATDSFNTWDLAFKVKGEKHSETKVRTLAAVDVENIENIRILVDSIVTSHRLDKRLEAMKEAGSDVDIKNTGVFLKFVAQDVLKEEKDTIEASGLALSEVMSRVSRVAKDYFMQAVNA